MNGLREINWEKVMGDGTFAPAKKGGLCAGKTKKGKGTKIMLLADRNGVPWRPTSPAPAHTK